MQRGLGEQHSLPATVSLLTPVGTTGEEVSTLCEHSSGSGGHNHPPHTPDESFLQTQHLPGPASYQSASHCVGVLIVSLACGTHPSGCPASS